MRRRDFLSYMTGSVLSGLPLFTEAALLSDQKILVLIELQGGNDGLNTLIPYADPHYRKLGPKLAIHRDKVLTLNETIGLHPACTGLYDIWQENQLAIVQGLGYPSPNRSHFRSIEIWETASDSDEILQAGWLAPFLNGFGTSNTATPSALVLGQDAGPLAGSPHNTVILSNMKRFLRQAKMLQELEKTSSNPSLRHILSVQNSMQNAATGFARALENAPDSALPFPSTQLGRQLATVCRLIRNHSGVRVYKLGIGSFDTHANQKHKHAALLQELSDAVSAFSSAMQTAGWWENILVMTYSEFGRRARENGSRGTDHGTAAPHFVTGGLVRGGLYGETSSLSDLENDDLKFTVDFRSMYRTVQSDWLGEEAVDNSISKYPILSFLKV